MKDIDVFLRIIGEVLATGDYTVDKFSIEVTHSPDPIGEDWEIKFRTYDHTFGQQVQDKYDSIQEK